MRRRTSISAALAPVFFSLVSALCHAESTLAVPDECRSAADSEVELVDCLQTQQEIVRHILEYETLLLEMEKVRQQRTGLPPPASIAETDASAPATETWDSVLQRVNWFDQNLEVYAIVGDAQSRTAHARLEGREYRLRMGDQVRLATIVRIEPRMIYLSIPGGAEFPIGLSGTANSQ